MLISLSFRDVLASLSRPDPNPHPAVTVHDVLTNPYATIAECITLCFKDTQVGNFCACFTS
jgi:hypothetical protein